MCISGVGGALTAVSDGVSEATLLPSPSDGVAVSSGICFGRADSKAGVNGTLAAESAESCLRIGESLYIGDFPKGELKFDAHDSGRGITRPGYRFLDVLLVTLFLVESVAKLVVSLELPSDGQVSLKTVPSSLSLRTLFIDLRL